MSSTAIDSPPKALSPWHQNHFLGCFFDGLSILLPAGEELVIRVLAQNENQADVQRLCAEEQAHQRAHTLYNQSLIERGYPVDELEQNIRQALCRYSQRLSYSEQLCLVAGFEYLTALMARLVLRGNWLRGAAPRQAKLWEWHCREELAHQHISLACLSQQRINYFHRVGIYLFAAFQLMRDIVTHVRVLSRIELQNRRTSRLILMRDAAKIFALTIPAAASTALWASFYFLPINTLKKFRIR